MTVLVLGVSSLRVEGASSIAQAFATDDPNIVSGALVSLKSEAANTIELSTIENVDRMLGVAGENALIELSNDDGTVQVITTGEAYALVSDINGNVEVGDKITASPIAGVGMKALTNTLVIGTAQASLSSVETETRTIRDKEGNERTVRIGAIPIQIDKVFYNVSQTGQSSFVPQALQDFANSIAGRSVSPIRVMIAGFLILFMFITVAILLYSSVRSSIISIGRNPLSERAVHKSLVQVGLTVCGVMVLTMFIVYLVLIT
ncbi:hypothetical protein IRY61_01205 [Candidatus Saccharibacteria bacterium]|nr:hypothetical protein [Candidatus Saccharibacteria bacterium]